MSEAPVTSHSGKRLTASTRRYFGVGCGVRVEAEGDTVTGARGNPPDHPANFSRLCANWATLRQAARDWPREGLKYGTRRGPCLPEIKGMLARSRAEVVECA